MMRRSAIAGVLAVTLCVAACSDAEFDTTGPSLSRDPDAGDASVIDGADGGRQQNGGGGQGAADAGDESDGDRADSGAEPACPAAQTLCGESCVDTASDDAHCGACDNGCAAAESCVSGSCQADVSPEVAAVFEATNTWRGSGADCGAYGQKDSTGALTLDPELSEAAQAHADDMVANNYFDHTGSDGSSFSDRVARTDYTGFAMGENIAAGGNEGAGVVQRWIDSDGHCRNLMNPDARHIGIGFAVGGPYGTMWVQVFGR